MSEFRGMPPDPRCGDPSPFTRHLRPRIAMDVERCQEARRMKRQDPKLSVAEIAGRLGASEADVRLALATLRCPNPLRSRATVNVTLETICRAAPAS